MSSSSSPGVTRRATTRTAALSSSDSDTPARTTRRTAVAHSDSSDGVAVPRTATRTAHLSDSDSSGVNVPVTSRRTAAVDSDSSGVNVPVTSRRTAAVDSDSSGVNVPTTTRRTVGADSSSSSAAPVARKPVTTADSDSDSLGVSSKPTRRATMGSDSSDDIDKQLAATTPSVPPPTAGVDTDSDLEDLLGAGPTTSTTTPAATGVKLSDSDDEFDLDKELGLGGGATTSATRAGDSSDSDAPLTTATKPAATPTKTGGNSSDSSPPAATRRPVASSDSSDAKPTATATPTATETPKKVESTSTSPAKSDSSSVNTTIDKSVATPAAVARSVTDTLGGIKESEGESKRKLSDSSNSPRKLTPTITPANVDDALSGRDITPTSVTPSERKGVTPSRGRVADEDPDADLLAELLYDSDNEVSYSKQKDREREKAIAKQREAAEAARIRRGGYVPPAQRRRDYALDDDDAALLNEILATPTTDGGDVPDDLLNKLRAGAASLDHAETEKLTAAAAVIAHSSHDDAPARQLLLEVASGKKGAAALEAAADAALLREIIRETQAQDAAIARSLIEASEEEEDYADVIRARDDDTLGLIRQSRTADDDTQSQRSSSRLEGSMVLSHKSRKEKRREAKRAEAREKLERENAAKAARESEAASDARIMRAILDESDSDSLSVDAELERMRMEEWRSESVARPSTDIRESFKRKGKKSKDETDTNEELAAALAGGESDSASRVGDDNASVTSEVLRTVLADEPDNTPLSVGVFGGGLMSGVRQTQSVSPEKHQESTQTRGTKAQTAATVQAATDEELLRSILESDDEGNASPGKQEASADSPYGQEDSAYDSALPPPRTRGLAELARAQTSTNQGAVAASPLYSSAPGSGRVVSGSAGPAPLDNLSDIGSVQSHASVGSPAEGGGGKKKKRVVKKRVLRTVNQLFSEFLLPTGELLSLTALADAVGGGVTPEELGHLRLKDILTLGAALEAADQRTKDSAVDRVIREARTTKSPWVSLASQNLRILHNNVTKLTWLEKLYLQSNELTALPPTIGRLRNLRVLAAPLNHIEVLPEEIGELKHLRELHLASNALTSIPSSLGDLESLTLLDLSDNRLNILPIEVSSLPLLESLDLSGNGLSSLPSHIERLKRLRGLYLLRNNLTSLPPAIGSLLSLTTLSLEGNQLVDLPEEILDLTELTRVSLERNPIDPTSPVVRELKLLCQHRMSLDSFADA